MKPEIYTRCSCLEVNVYFQRTEMQGVGEKRYGCDVNANAMTRTLGAATAGPCHRVKNLDTDGTKGWMDG